MNILIIVDKNPSAIYYLSEDIKKYNPHFNIEILPVHPKRADIDTIHKLQGLADWADIIHVNYWKSGNVLKSTFPVLWKKKTKILTHHNPYNLREEKWEDYEAIVVKNQTQQITLPVATLIPHCVDLNYFKFQEKLPKEKVVCMVASRIEGKKGIREVAQACKELGYKFKLVGRVSKAPYMKEIIKVGGHNLEFYENTELSELKEIYYQSGLHVCNSVDNFESGTMPILESMACGVPVLTRNVGLVPDIFNGKNMVVRTGEQNDIEDLKTNIKEMMENYSWRMKLRGYAWDTVKNRNAERSAAMYSKLYYQLRSDKPLVSVILPICNPDESIVDVLSAILTQTYENIEIVIADSSQTSNENLINQLKSTHKIPIKYIRIQRAVGEYTLAKARNEAVIEAEGKILVFCDDRLQMHEKAVEVFVEYSQSKVWLWGKKDGYEKGFVENFSSVNRKEFISAGMFNERINQYGGMTQEIRMRFERNGFIFNRIPVEALSVKKSGNKSKKDNIWRMKHRLWKMYN